MWIVIWDWNVCRIYHLNIILKDFMVIAIFALLFLLLLAF